MHDPIERAQIFCYRQQCTNNAFSLKLKTFQKFDSAATALEEAASVMEGKVTPRLASLLDGIKEEKKVSLAVCDTKLGRCF
jgi:RNA processing factor Prp31